MIDSVVVISALQTLVAHAQAKANLQIPIGMHNWFAYTDHPSFTCRDDVTRERFGTSHIRLAASQAGGPFVVSVVDP